MSKSRRPLQVSPKFWKKLKDIQENIMRNKGKKISIDEIADMVISTEIFNDIENSIINKDLKLDIKMRLDRR
jgi:hypothetical protein